MKNCLILIIVSIFLLSCASKPNSSPDSIDNYKLRFSKAGKLEGMKKGVFGMGYTTDGKYLYGINGSVMGYFIRSGIGAISITQYGDVTGGINTGRITIADPTADLFRYCIEDDKWSVIPNILRPKRFTSAEFVNGKIYVFNGQELEFYDNRFYRTAIKEVEVVDPYLNIVSILINNPNPVWYAGSAVWNDKIYTFGGAPNESQFSNKLHVFDTVNENWKQLPDMPEHKQTRGEIVNGILYVFGGYNGTVSSKIHAYDIENNTWQHLGDLPFGISANAITKHGNLIWLVGDYHRLSIVGVFDTKANLFHIIKSNMFGRRHAGAEIIGNKLYVFGGNRESSGSFLTSIQVADITEIEMLISQK
jgi:N-acetylneuraminic acid mutarotase